MGYYTFFDLSWDVAEDSDEERSIIAWMDSDEIGDHFEDFYPGGACGMSKWRDDEADMIRLSAAFPSVLFTLSGSGEEETDLWRSYYRAGCIQHAPAEIHYPPFAPAKLAAPNNTESPTPDRADEATPEADALANHEARKGPWQ